MIVGSRRDLLLQDAFGEAKQAAGWQGRIGLVSTCTACGWGVLDPGCSREVSMEQVHAM